MIVYMEVTKDKYELPLGVFDSIQALADSCNVKPQTVKATISRTKNGTIAQSRYRKVEI